MRFDEFIIILGIILVVSVSFAITGRFMITGRFIQTSESHLQVLNLAVEEDQAYDWNLSETCPGINCSLSSIRVSGSIIANNSGYARIYIENLGKMYLILDESFELNTIDETTTTTTSTTTTTTTTSTTTTTINETNTTETNMTEPVINTTEETTNQTIIEPEVFYFAEKCVETCEITDLFNKTSYNIIFELTTGFIIKLDSIEYIWNWSESKTTTSTAPETTTTLNETTTTTIPVNQTTTTLPEETTTSTTLLNETTTTTLNETTTTTIPTNETTTTSTTTTTLFNETTTTTTIPSIETAVIETIQREAEVEKPVKWFRRMVIFNPFSQTFYNLTVEAYVPFDAFDIIITDDTGLSLVNVSSWTIQEISPNDSIEYTIEYFTKAPRKLSTEPLYYPNGTWLKEVLVESNASVHYENMRVHETVPTDIDYYYRLFLVKGGNSTDVSDDPKYNFTVVDNTSYWTIPYLSSKTFILQGDPRVELEVEFDRHLDCHKCGMHKAPPLADVNMTISALVSNPVENANLTDYYPNEWAVIDAKGGNISEYNSSYNKIEWDVGNITDSVSKWYVIKSPQKTSPPTKYYFFSELANQSSDLWQVIVADPDFSKCDINITNSTIPYTIDQSNTYYCLIEDIGWGGVNGISFASGVQNSILDCLGYTIDSNDTYQTYGIYFTGSNTKNNTIKNCNIRDFHHAILLSGSSNSNNNFVNNIVYDNTNVGFYIALATNNNLKDNIVYDNGAGFDIYLSSNNNLVNNSVYDNTYGFYIFESSNNNITKGSVWGNTYDYWLWDAGTTNNFTDTNFTAERKIRFYGNSWFNYNNESTGKIWLKNNVSTQPTITRELTFWSQNLMQWNDSSTSAVTARYNITGLKENTVYFIYNNSQFVQTLQTDPFGDLPSFTIYLSSEHEIKVQEEDTTPPQIEFVPPTPDNDTTTSNNSVYVNVSISDDSNTSSFIDWNRSLVGYWAMDWYNSSGVFDNSTYNNFGAFQGGLGTSNITTGKYGYGLDFDGSNYRVNISDYNEKLNLTDAFTFEAWIYPIDWGENNFGRIIDKATGNLGEDGYTFYIRGPGYTDLTVYIDNAEYDSAADTISLNVWQHVVATFDGQNVKFYINGSNVLTESRTDPVPTNNRSLYIGNRETLGRTFNGTIDEVRIFNRALSPEEINASYNSGLYRLYHNFTNLEDNDYDYYAYSIDTVGYVNKTGTRTVTVNTKPIITWENPTPGNDTTTNNDWVYLNTTVTSIRNTSSFLDWNYSLVGYWAMDWYNSTGVFDNSTYNNFGAFQGGLGTSNITTGKYGYGLDFDGNGDMVNIIEGDIPNSSLTIMAWIYPKKFGGGGGDERAIVSKWGAGTSEWLFRLTNSSTPQLQFYITNLTSTAKQRSTSNANMQLNEWAHVVVVYNRDAEQVYFYKNGVDLAISGGNQLDATRDGSSIIRIGAQGGGTGDYFNGTIDEVRIWNRVLSDEEINASYNSGLYRLYHNFTDLSDGVYEYYAFAIDTVGYANKTGIRTVTVDTKPIITWETPTPGNDTTTNNDWVYLNTTVTSPVGRNTSSFLDWNYSLVGYWAMDWYNTTGVYDNSTWNNFGTFQNGIGTDNITDGKYGNALEFDGVNDYVNCIGPSLNFTGAITVDVWVNPKNNTGKQWARFVTAPDNFNMPYALSLGGEKTRVQFGYKLNGVNYRNRTGTGLLTEGNWHHVVGVGYGNGTIKIYVDGIERSLTTVENITYISGTGVYLGNRQDYHDQARFNGTIDEVRIWNRALSPEEIKASYNSGLYRLYHNFTNLEDNDYDYYAYSIDDIGYVNKTGTRTVTVNTKPIITWEKPTPGDDTTTNNDWVYLNTTVTSIRNTSSFLDWNYSLVGYWAMDWYNATGIFDNSTWNNFGTFQNGINPDNITDGKYGRGLEFDGTYVSAQEQTNLDGFNEITISVWVKPNQDYAGLKDNGWYGGFWKKSGSYSIGWQGWTDGLTASFYNTSGARFYRDTGIDLYADIWYHVVITFDFQTIKYYIDGEYVDGGLSGGNNFGAMQDNSNPVNIGLGYSTYFNGTIDEVQIYNRALSPEEIKASYNSGLYRLYHNFTNLEDNDYDYYAYSIDTVGYVNKTGTRTVTVDTVYPQIEFVNPTDSTGVNINRDWSYVNVSITDSSDTSSFIDWNKSLIGYWAMDWYNSSGIFDNSTYNNFGKFEGGLGANDITYARYGKGLEFDLNQYINCSNSSIFNPPMFTLEGWVYLKYWSSNYPRVISKETSLYADPYALELDSYNKRVYMGVKNLTNNEAWAYTPTNSFKLNQWHHVAGTFNGTHVIAYIDGKPGNSVRVYYPGPNPSTHVLIGNNPQKNRDFNGIIDEVKIWNRVLSIEEINASYNSGLSRLYHNFTDIDDGQYDYYAFVIDAGGNTNQTETRTLTVDAVSPQIEFIPPTDSDNAYVNRNYSYVNVSVSDYSNTSSFIDWNNSLVGYWAMDWYNFTGVYDNSTYNNFGTFKNGIGIDNITTGKYGYGLIFNGNLTVGNGDYVQVPYNSVLDVGNYLTIEAWIYPKQIKQADFVHYTSIGGAVKYVIGMHASGRLVGSLCLSGGCVWPQSATGLIVADNWYHVALTWNSTNASLYLSGEEVDVDPGSGSINTNNRPLFIGSANGTSLFFNGTIDEVRIWNRALSPEELNASYNSGLSRLYHNFTDIDDGQYDYYAYSIDAVGNANKTETRTLTVDTVNPQIEFVLPTPPNDITQNNNSVYVNVSVSDASNTSSLIDWNRSLVGYWAMDWYNSSGIFDNSTYNNFGTFLDSLGPDNITDGRYGRGLKFIDDRVRVNNHPSLNITDAITIEAWVYMLDNSRYIVSKWESYILQHFQGRFQAGIYVDGAWTVLVDPAWGTAPGNTWSHVVFTYDRNLPADQAKLYLNGNLIKNGTNTSKIDSTTNDVYIGNKYNSNQREFNGTIDEVRIYNRALGSEEINASYNSGLSRLYHNFTDLSDGVYEYYAYSIDASGNANKTETRTLNYTQPYLEVNLTQPDPTVYDEANPLEVDQNTTFDVNTTVYCRIGDCGTVYGTVRYNKSSSLPDTPINTTEEATPFYIKSALVRPVEYKNSSTTQFDPINPYPEHAYDKDFNDSSTYVTIYTSVAAGTGRVNYTYSLSATEATLFARADGMGGGDEYLQIYNFTSGQWYDWITLTDTTTTYNTVISTSSGMISSTGHAILSIYINDTLRVLSLYDTYVNDITNKSSCGPMLKNQYCYLKWYVNVTGNQGTSHKIDVNFTFNSLWNDTEDAVIKITENIPPTWFDNKIYPTSGITYSSEQNYQFNVTWNDNTGIDTVLIEQNFTTLSSSLENQTMSNESSEYYYDVSDLPAGTYVWRSYANDTSNNWNYTDQWTYTVNKAKPVLIMSNDTAEVNSSGLVGYWKFEEGVDTNVRDSSGYGNNGTISGDGDEWVGGRFGQALEFDGVNDYVTIADDDALDDLSAFTISLWGNQQTYTDNAGLVVKYKISSGYRSYQVRTTDTDEIAVALSDDGDSYEDDISVNNCGFTSNDVWTFLTIVYNSTHITYYKNGAYCDINVTSENSIYNSLQPLEFGNRYDSGWFNGTIDEVRIWNRSLSADEIKELYESRVTYGTQTNFSLSEQNTGDEYVYYDFYRNGTVSAIWYFDEGEGNYAFDDTGNNYTGLLENSTHGVPQWTTGKYGSALEFDGEGDFIEVDKDMPNTSLTIMAWIYPKEITDDQRAIASRWNANAAGDEWIFRIETGVECPANELHMQLKLEDSSSVGACSSGADIETNKWQHVIVVYNRTSGNVTFYKNGTQFGESYEGKTQDGSTKIRIGAQTGGSYDYFNGTIDEVKIYQRALSSKEILCQYANNCSEQGYLNETATLPAGYYYYVARASEGENYTTSSLLLPLKVEEVSDTEPPQIEFVSPTLDDGTTQNNNSVYINVSIEDDSNTSSLIDWNRSLVGYWAMDWYNSSGIFDNSTYNNFGTFSGGLSEDNITSGKYGYGLEFDGNNDYVDCRNDTSLNIIEAITIEAWIYPKGWGGNDLGRIACKQSGYDVAYCFYLQGSYEFIKFMSVIPPGPGTWVVNGSSYSNTIKLNQWQHVVVTYNRKNLTFYINGKEDRFWPDTDALHTNTVDLRIGNRDEGDRTFNGTIDELRIYDRALSPEEINASYNSGLSRLYHNFTDLSDGVYEYYAYSIDASGNANKTETRSLNVDTQAPRIEFIPPTDDDSSYVNRDWSYVNVSVTDDSDTSSFIDWNRSLVGYWAMDWYNSTGIFDNSSYNNFGTFNGGLGTGNITTGKYGYGLSFDGVNDYVDAKNASNLNMRTSEWTVGAWIKTAFDYHNGILNTWNGGGGADNYRLVVGDDVSGAARGRVTFVFYDQSSTYPATSTTYVNDSNLHYVVGVRNSTHVKIYVDGKEEGRSLASSSLDVVNTANLRIGRGFSVGWNFNGTIDEVQIYNRALSSEEINASYNSGLYRLYHNFTDLNDGTYEYYAYAIDTAGNANKTETRTLTVDTVVPQYSNNSTNNTAAGLDTEFSLYWTDNFGLSGYVFSTNNTGGWINDSFTEFENVIFEDGFETGDFSRWNGTPTGNPEINSTYKVNGTYSMKMNQTQEYVTKYFENTTGIYWSWWVRHENLPNSSGYYMRYCGLEGSGVSTRIVSVELYNQTGNMKIRLVENYPSSANVYSDPITIATGEWHHIITRFKKDVNGGYQVWFDNSLVLSDLGKNTTLAGDADELRIGYGSESGGPYTLFMDDIKIYEKNQNESWSNITKILNDTVGARVEWCVYANDTSNNWNITSCETPFSLTTTSAAPQWSNNSTNIPTTYFPVLSIFNITWTNADKVLIEMNYSGVNNYTMTNIEGNVYSYNVTLPAGTYYWKSYANDSSDNWNYTDTWYFTIEKAKPVLIMSNATAEVNTSGLVGYWRFEEGVGTDVRDSSGWDNNGTLKNKTSSCGGTACPSWTSERFGNALEFDGVGDYVETGLTSVNNQSFTLSAWINWNNKSESSNILSKPYFASLLVRGDANPKYRLSVRLYPTGDIYDNIPMPFGWHHVAYTYTVGSQKLYRDGIEVGSTSYSDSSGTNANPFYIGNYDPGRYSFNGTIDEVRIWNRSLTADEIKELYESRVSYGTQTNFTLSEQNTGDTDVYYDFFRNGTVAGIWHFDEGEGSYTFDDSGNNNTGTLENSTHGVPQWTTDCKYGSCLEFDGEGDYVSVSSVDDFKTLEMTVSAWIYPKELHSDDGKRKYILARAVSGNKHFRLGIDVGDDLFFTMWNSTGEEACSLYTEIDVQKNQWSYVVAGFNGTHCFTFLNGVKNTTNYTSPINYDIDEELTIGRRPGYTDQDFNGTIDEVRFWNRALSDEEILCHYGNNCTEAGFNNESVTLPTGYHYYVSRASEGENYTTSALLLPLNVTEGVASCSLTSSSGWTYVYGIATTLQCSCIGDGTTHLYFDEIQHDDYNDTPIIFAANPSGYSIVCNITKGSNYGSASNSSTLTINKAPTSIDLFLNDTDGDRDYHSNESVNITADLNVSFDVEIWTNFTGSYARWDEGPEPFMNYTTMDYGLGPFNITANFSGNQNYSASYDSHLLTVWGWSNLSWISPDDGDYLIGNIITLNCSVLDANLSTPIQNYPVNFYNETDTGSSLLGTNTTDSSGYAIYRWNTSDVVAGTYYPKCNITDNSTLYYNVSVAEANTTITLSMNQAPNIWNLVVRNFYNDNPLTETATGVTVNITVNVSDSNNNLDYVEGNFTWPNGTIVYENLTSVDGRNYTHVWVYFIPWEIPNGTSLINVTAYDTFGASNSTNTTLTIWETIEIVLLNQPINFTSVYPGIEVNATTYQGWPLNVSVLGNVPVNLSQKGEHMTGKVDPTVDIKVENITWNQTESGLFSGLVTNYIVINESKQHGEYQYIYYKLNVPVIKPQPYGGNVYIKGEQT
jgi:parallel beta-helix repeat protein